MSEPVEAKDSLTLKWGTLKAWDMKSERGQELLKQYVDLGSSVSAMLQNDSAEQKDILCMLIDECTADQIYLDWEGECVSKEAAKKYLREYDR
jgi:hypothetical protein